MTKQEKLERTRKVVLNNTETLLNLYKSKMNKMDKQAVHEYGDIIFKLLDELDNYEKDGDWYLGWILI